MVRQSVFPGALLSRHRCSAGPGTPSRMRAASSLRGERWTSGSVPGFHSVESWAFSTLSGIFLNRRKSGTDREP